MPGALQGEDQPSKSRSAVEWAPAKWLEEAQREAAENINNELELKDAPKKALCLAKEQPFSQKRARIEGPNQDRALTLLLKMGMNSQQRLRKIESCME